MTSKVSGAPEITTAKYWVWQVFHRIVWVALAGAPTFIAGEVLMQSVRFYLDARPQLGLVEADGIVVKEVMQNGRYSGPWSYLTPVPWIDVSYIEPSGASARCRISGQGSVLGEWISDDLGTLERALRSRVKEWQSGIKFFRSDRLRQCSVSRYVGLDHAFIFLPFFLLTVGLLVATSRSLGNRYLRRRS